jgi:hypothetical protein
MAESTMDATTIRIIREMRERAHLFSCWENPRVSRVAAILNAAADELEACVKSSDNTSQK